MAATLQFPVRYEPIAISSFADDLDAKGGDEYFVQHLTSVAQDYRNGIFAGADNLVEVITGTSASTVEQFVTANREAFTTATAEAAHD
jgi:hypothetical protein